MMKQLVFAGIEIDESPAKVREAAREGTANAVKTVKIVAKAKHPPRKGRNATAAISADDRPRLKAKAAAVLARLKIGPATNVELAAVGGHRFGARLHELRQASYPIKLVSNKRGVTTYQLGDQ